MASVIRILKFIFTILTFLIIGSIACADPLLHLSSGDSAIKKLFTDSVISVQELKQLYSFENSSIKFDSSGKVYSEVTKIISPSAAFSIVVVGDSVHGYHWTILLTYDHIRHKAIDRRVLYQSCTIPTYRPAYSVRYYELKPSKKNPYEVIVKEKIFPQKENGEDMMEYSEMKEVTNVIYRILPNGKIREMK